MASPHAAGAAMLLRNSFPEADGPQIVRCMISSADKAVTPNPRVGGVLNPAAGVLNLQASVACLRAVYPDPSPPLPPPAATETCGACSANGLCNAAGGCRCIATARGEACTCSRDGGFEAVSVMDEDAGTRVSYCACVGRAMEHRLAAPRVRRIRCALASKFVVPRG